MEELNIIYRNNGKTIVEDKYKKTYIMEEDNHAVVILARYLNSFIFVKQFRRAVNDDVIQLPGGKVEKGEELEEAARREFLEEAGAQCGNMDYLGPLVPASWISNVVTHVFYTDDIINFSDQQLEEYESIEVLRVSIEDTVNMIKESKINGSEVTFAVLQGILKGYIKL